MLQNIITYVNFYFPQYKREDTNPNFIRFCLVCQFLIAHYLSKNAPLDQIMIIKDLFKNAFPSTRSIATNHQIFSLAFNEFWEQYKKGRGKVYVFDSPFKQWSFLGKITGLLFWFMRDFIEPPTSESKM